MNTKFYFTLCLVSVLNVSLMAQAITVNSPVSRMVFQRGGDNFATVPVRGSVQGQTNRVKGRLVARQGGQTTHWREGTVQDGAFQLNIPAAGGFYDLELIALAGTTELERQRRERIGVGEVFVVTGQSNNFGILGQGLPASDDRVSVVNQWQVNSNDFDENALPMAFSQAGPGTYCGPLNPLFIWGGLGDRLVAKLGVPVLFLGVSQPGSSTKNWREAAQGIDRVSGRDWYNNTPYRPLRVTLQRYASQLGIRGILWHQGESDNNYQTTDGYVDNMRILIAKTREDSKFSNLSWMIARVTYYPYPGHEVDPGIIAGQDRVINEISNCFPGPSTDEFIGPTYRQSNQIHFADYAYPFLADLWSQSLSNEYFQRSQPSLPNVGPASAMASSDNANSTSTTPTNTNPPASTRSLQLGTPNYNCQSGVITFRVASTNGSGNHVEFMVPGVTGWTTNSTHTLGEGVRRDAQTLTIFARQSGQETSLIWNIRGACDGSIVTPPVNQATSTNTTQPPVQSGNATGSSFAVLSPTYYCQTGVITFSAGGGNGSTVEFMVPGVTGWTTNPNHTLGEGVRRDAQTLTIFARQLGQETSLTWNIRGACDGSSPTPSPTPNPVVNAPVGPAKPIPSGSIFSLEAPAYDCPTGTMVLKTTGGNGSLIEFMAPGVTGWTTNTTHILEAGVRRDAQTLTIFARQLGQQVSFVWNIRGVCTGVGVARVAQEQGSTEPKLVVIPNPATDQVQLIWPELARSSWISRFVSASGYEMSVPVVSNQDGLQATIKHLATGVYLWQITVKGRLPLTFRVMKVE